MSLADEVHHPARGVARAVVSRWDGAITARWSTARAEPQWLRLSARRRSGCCRRLNWDWDESPSSRARFRGMRKRARCGLGPEVDVLRVGAPGAMDEDARCVCCRVGSCSDHLLHILVQLGHRELRCRAMVLAPCVACVLQNQFPSECAATAARGTTYAIRSHPSQMSSWSSLSALWQNSQPSHPPPRHSHLPREVSIGGCVCRLLPPTRRHLDATRWISGVRYICEDASAARAIVALLRPSVYAHQAERVVA